MMDLHFYTKGLLYLHIHGKVVETTLRFCMNKSCVTNITSTVTNVRPLIDFQVYKDPLIKLPREQRANIQVEGFTIVGADPIDFS